jgi:hypothetical protein
MFTVNNMSSSKLGSGTISIAMINRTINGIPKLAIVVWLRLCRKNDSTALSIFS